MESRGNLDASLVQTHLLPNGAATTQGTGLDLKNSSRADQVCDAELIVTVPALTTGQLGDTQTITYSVEHDTDPAFGTAVVLAGNLYTQTGAGGAGAAGTTLRVGLPSTTKRYVRLKTVKTGASNASAVSATLAVGT